MQAIKGIFFDWDGTLVDSFEFLHSAHNYTRQMLGIEPFSIETFGQYFGQPREKLYKELYGDSVEAAKAHFQEYVLANHIDGIKAIDGAQELLEAIHDAGITCGIVTNKQGSLVQKEIENLGWPKYFTAFVGAAEAEADKPSAAPLLLAVERAGLLNEDLPEILFVGDTDNDVMCANSAGAQSVLIDNEDACKLMSQNHKVDYHFESLLSFLDFLLQSNLNSLKTKP